MGTPFAYVDGRLCAGAVPLEELAARHGTPLYVYHHEHICDRVYEVRRAFSSYPTRLCYSVKANPNIGLLHLLAQLDLGFDIVSAGELARLRAADVSADRVLFAGVGKTEVELYEALKAELWMITVESVGELRRLYDLAEEEGKRGVRIALRLNPDVDAHTHPKTTTGRSEDKFGMVPEEFDEAVALLRLQGGGEPVLDPVGLHLHIGSQVVETAPYRAAVEYMVARLEELRGIGSGVRWLNPGGGFGISYDGAPVPSAADYAQAILPALEGTDTELVLELGRYLVGPAGVLLTEVQYVKPRGGGPLAIVDAGMNALLRPALYGAGHRITPVAEPSGASDNFTTVAGPICESSDIYAAGIPLPPLQTGDLLAIMDVGAYGMSMASDYNSQPRPAEVIVSEEGRVCQLRCREPYDQLFSAERIGMEENAADGEIRS